MAAVIIAGLSMVWAGRVHAGEPLPAASTAGGPPRWLVGMAYVGIHQHTRGTNAEDYGPGLRLGALAGWRANEFLSVNVQGLVDQVRTESRLALGTYWVPEVALAPLAHFRQQALEFLIGPRAGLWLMSADYQPPIDGSTEHRRGWTLGANAGLMLRTRVGLSLGVLIDFHTREGSRSCVTGPGQAESCLAGWRSTEEMLAISFVAALSPELRSVE